MRWIFQILLASALISVGVGRLAVAGSSSADALFFPLSPGLGSPGLGSPGPGSTAVSPVPGRPEVRADLLSSVQGTGTGEPVILGLRFSLMPKWKVYWRSPGEAGYPTAFDWSGSDNLAAVDVAWPVPHRFDLSGIQTVGYETEVILPVIVRLADPSRPLAVRLAVDYLTCSEICVPAHATLAIDIPSGPATPSAEAEIIAASVDRVPMAQGKIALSSLVLEEGDETPSLTVTLTSQTPMVAPDLFVEGPTGEDSTGLISGKPSVVAREDDGRRVTLRVPLSNPVRADQVSALTVTAMDGDYGSEMRPSAQALVLPTDEDNSSGLWLMIGLAVAGGLILNVMPCVLPVLGLKLMTVVSLQGEERWRVRLAFVATTAGIILTFLGLAVGLIVLKATGASIGWGIQFQNPVFLGVMIGVLVLFALNLWGLYQIPLPGFIASWAERETGSPSRAFGGHVLTGVLATLLATPCSAPFLGTAVGFALARGSLETIVIFTALGVGMSLPYLGVAAVPKAVAYLPRPGRWMATVRKVFAVALVGTAIWLGTVLAGSLSGAGQEPETAWTPFDHAAITAHVARGETVFVDITAAWCVTCKVNKISVLDRNEIAERLRAPGVVAMRGDWTTPDPVLSTYMAEHGRYGVPFNAVYGPRAPQGVVLPELLTRAKVIEALEKVR